MITFLEYSFLEEAHYYIQSQENRGLDLVLNPNQYIEKLKPTRWKDIDNLGSQSIFEEDGSMDLTPMVDISSLKINTKLSELTKSLENSINIYLYNPDNRKLIATDKQILKKAGIEYKILKQIPSSTKEELLEKYLSTHQVDKSKLNVKKILQLTSTLHEAIDVIDLCTLEPEYLKTLQSPTLTQLYMQNFRPGNKHDIRTWHRETKEQELQLAISLILTKLKKQHNVSSSVQNLINLDHRIKTLSKTKPHTWYKYFLWQSAQKT